MLEKKNEKLNLYWLCKQTGKKFPAGVAFFNESQADYRLKIDTMPDDKLIYLKVSSLVEGAILYRVESAVKKQGRVTHRAEIGSGHAKTDEGSPVYMDIGPFERTLVMESVA